MEFVILHPATFFQNMKAAWPAIVEHGIIAEPYAKSARLARVDYRDVAEVVAIALGVSRARSSSLSRVGGVVTWHGLRVGNAVTCRGLRVGDVVRLA